jgi:hypothetical protein
MTPRAFTQNAELINSQLNQSRSSFENFFPSLVPAPAELGPERLLQPLFFSSNTLSLELSQEIAAGKKPGPNRAQRRAANALELIELPMLAEVCVEKGAPIVRDANLVVDELVLDVREPLAKLMATVDSGASPRQIEEETWKLGLPLLQSVLGHLLARSCAQLSKAEIEKQGLSPESVRPRLDQDYHLTLTTTLGEIVFPHFAYRVERENGQVTTHSPARDQLFPFYKECRSSELCLEWESRLASQQTFRESEVSLSFFSHGVVKLSDTTIARHTVNVGSIIDRDQLYRSPAEIKKILATQATRDKKTGRPIVYFSTDAHSLRRYIDDTWHGAWKMANGLRIWCIDRKTDQIIHLGGEYTWGDCEAVENIFRSLVESGHLPANGDYCDDIQAKYVIVTDGATWIEQRIVPIFPGSCAVLDAYHALETISKYGKEIFGSETPEAREFYQAGVKFLLGEKERTPRSRKNRKGHKKNRKANQDPTDPPVEPDTAYDYAEALECAIPSQVQAFIEFVEAINISTEKKEESKQRLIDFLRGNKHRINYLGYRIVGYKIGSGAMESLHRTGSQIRLKLPGARWLQETAQAIFNIRMMTIVGKWNEFWNQPNITEKLKMAFMPKPAVAAA